MSKFECISCGHSLGYGAIICPGCGAEDPKVVPSAGCEHFWVPYRAYWPNSSYTDGIMMCAKCLEKREAPGR